MDSLASGRKLRRIPGGLLIVIEGIDGSGKTTQCDQLARRLIQDGWDVERLREPTDGPCGRRIRELARSGRKNITPRQELNLFIRDREENVRQHIRPALSRGAIIVMDRYYYSTIAYQGARGLDPAMIRAENERFAPPAGLLLYLAISVETAVCRIRLNRPAGLDLFEKADYLAKVKALFDTLPDTQLARIDAEALFEDVSERIWAIVASRLPQ